MRVTLAPVAGVVVRLAHSLLQTRNLVTYLVGAPAMGVLRGGVISVPLGQFHTPWRALVGTPDVLCAGQ